MRYLLDTHVLIWWITTDHRLSESAIKIIQNRKNLLYWSTASSWEMSIKTALGRLELEEPLEFLLPAELEKNQIEIMPVKNDHALLAGQLPLHHKDPFDRMLIAQARIESLGIITNDSKFRLYDADVHW